MTPTERPRIVIVMRSGEWRGGAEQALYQLVRPPADGAPASVDWTVVFLEPGRLAEDIRALGVDTEVVNAGRLRHVHRWLASIAALRRILRGRRPRLCVAWMADAHLYLGPAALLARVPSTFYQVWVPRPSWVDRLATALPTRGVLAGSATIADAQRQLRPQRELPVVHFGADVGRFDAARLPDRQTARQALGLPLDVPLLGFVGRLERWKGPQTLIEALPAVLVDHPEAMAVLVGSEHPRAPGFAAGLRMRAEQLNVVDHVIFAGEQSSPETWMAAFDVCIHASDTEPFGIVVVEALATGRPVIAGNAGGPTEVITDGVDGLLTPFEDAPALASAIQRLLDDPMLASRLGEAGRRRAPAFSADAFTSRMTSTLLDLATPARSMARHA